LSQAGLTRRFRPLAYFPYPRPFLTLAKFAKNRAGQV